ncbi:MAG: hypothetical protein IID55_14250 [Proteobacteria bacterium]|nr:hypothetical protein [Pseudomonadota bacterium]
MHRPRWHRALQFLNGFENPQPGNLARYIVLSREGISALHGLSGGGLAVPVDEQLGGAPEVDVAYDLRLALGFFRGFV